MNRILFFYVFNPLKITDRAMKIITRSELLNLIILKVF